MAESFVERRKRELGLTSSSSSTVETPSTLSGELSFVDKRKIALGLMDDPRVGASAPVPVFKPERFSMEAMNVANSPLMQQASQVPKQLPGRNLPVIGPVLRGLDWLSDNPFSNSVAEHVKPNQPLLQSQGANTTFGDIFGTYFDGVDEVVQSGTNARRDFLQRSNIEPATGISKFIGEVAAPFFVPGAGIGTGEPFRASATSLAGRALGDTTRGAMLREGMIGAGVGVASEYAQGQADAGNAAINAVAGAGLGAAFPLIGGGISAAARRSTSDLLAADARPNLRGAVDDFMRRNIDPTFTRNVQEYDASSMARAGDEAAARFNFIDQRANPDYIGLQEPIAQRRYNEALERRSQPVYGSDAIPANESPINFNRLTYKGLPSPDPEFAAQAQNMDEAAQMLKEINRRIKSNETRMQTKPTESLRQIQDSLIQARDEVQRSLDEMQGIQRGEIGEGLKREVIGPKPNLKQSANKLKKEPPQKPVQATNTADNAMVQPTAENAPAAIVERPTAPQELEPNHREYKTFTSLKNSDKVPDEVIQKIGEKGETIYEVKKNQTTVDNANRKLSELGDDEAKSYLLGKGKDDQGRDAILSSDDVALGYRLIDNYIAKGDNGSAADVALKLMQSNLEGGRTIQINAIYNRLTPEGALRVATKVYNRGVQSLADQKAIPADTAVKITEAAQKLQSVKGDNAQVEEVIRILDRAQDGNKLSDAEIAVLTDFQKRTKEYTPNTKETPTQPRKRDKIAQASSKQAEEARKRLAASKNIGFLPGKGNPIVDYAIIGVDHMVQKSIMYADFAEALVKEFGKGIEKDMDEIYISAYDRYKKLNGIKTSEFERIVNQAITTKELKGPDSSKLKRMAIELNQLHGEVRREALGELQGAFHLLREGSTGQKLASTLRSVQLGNARTLIRNEIANQAFYALESIQRKFLATPLDLILSTFNGTERQVFFKNNQNAWNQYFKDMKVGWQAGKKGINPNGLETQYDLGGLAFNPNSERLKGKPVRRAVEALGSFMERHVGALMKASDYASASRAIANEMYRMAAMRARSDGLKGKALQSRIESYIALADEEMTAAAREYGEYMTFQDKNFLSNIAVDAKKLMNKIGTKDGAFGLGNFVLNYPKTPANLMMRAIDYSPAGYIRFMGQMYSAVANKGATRNEIINTFSRATVGSGMAAIGMYMASLGMMNVLPSKDKSVNELEKMAGVISNSVNISALKRYVLSFGDKEKAKPQKGDTWASVDWLQPMAMTSSVGASWAQAQEPSRLAKGVNAASAVGQSLDAALQSAGNMSVFRSIKELFAGKYPGQSVDERVTDFATNAASAFVPSLLKQARNAADPVARDTKGETFGEQIQNKLSNTVPGLSDNLRPQLDSFGKEKQSDYGPVARTLNAFINPSLIDEYNPSKEAETVLKLINSTGDTTIAPNAPRDTLTYKNKSYKLTPEQHEQLKRETGALIEKGLTKNLNYLNGNRKDESKLERVDEILREAGEKAKTKLRREMGIR